jgi:hypothetical protein
LKPSTDKIRGCHNSARNIANRPNAESQEVSTLFKWPTRVRIVRAAPNYYSMRLQTGENLVASLNLSSQGAGIAASAARGLGPLAARDLSLFGHAPRKHAQPVCSRWTVCRQVASLGQTRPMRLAARVSVRMTSGAPRSRQHPAIRPLCVRRCRYARRKRPLSHSLHVLFCDRRGG